MITHKTSWLLAGLLCLALWPASAFAQIEPSRTGHSGTSKNAIFQILTRYKSMSTSEKSLNIMINRGAHSDAGAERLKQVLDELARTGPNRAGLSNALRSLPDEPRFTKIGEKRIKFQFSDGSLSKYHIHPQGMARDHRTGEFYVSAEEIIMKKGPETKGNAYLFRFSPQWKPIQSISLKAVGDEIHPGGIDIHENTLYVPVSPHRRRSSATIFEMPLDTRNPAPLFPVTDYHIGFVALNPSSGEYHMMSWDAAMWFRFSRDGQRLEARKNPTFDKFSYQDAQVLTDSSFLLTGVASICGPRCGPDFGLDLINGKTGNVEKSIRWAAPPHRNAQGWVPLQNPTYIWLDHRGRILVLGAPNSQVGEHGDRVYGPKDAGTEPWQSSLLLYEISRKQK